MDNWSFDTDGIIDYYSMFKEQISNKYGIENAKKLYEIIEKKFALFFLIVYICSK